MLVIGDKEVQNNVVAVKSRTGEDKGAMNVEELSNMFNQEINNAMKI